MNLSKWTDEQCSRWIAERLGWKGGLCGYQWQGVSITHCHKCIENVNHTRTSGVMDWETPHRCSCKCILDSQPHQYERLPDMVSDPAMMVMLLKRIIDRSNPTNKKDWALIGSMVALGDYSLGRAVAETTMLMEGWKE